MYNVTDETVRQRIEQGCVYGIWLESDSEVITSDEVFDASSAQSSTSLSDDIELGAVCAAGWKIRLTRDGSFLGKKFKLYLYIVSSGSSTTWGTLEAYTAGELSRLTVEQVGRLGETVGGEKIPMGVFTCVKAPRKGDSRELHLYDAIYFADKPYTPMITLPALASAVEDDICGQLGIENGDETEVGGFVEALASQHHRNPGLLQEFAGGLIYTAPFDFTIEDIPAGATMRDVLGYIAAIHGQFGCIDRSGRYNRRWYAPQSLATIDSDHADEPTISEIENHIVGIRCKTGNEELMAGSMTGGRVLELENPFMTDTLVRALFAKVRKMSWYTSQVSERLGDPRHDIGDTVTIMPGGEQYDIPITNLEFSFDGGLLANISAAGLTEEEQTI